MDTLFMFLILANLYLIVYYRLMVGHWREEATGRRACSRGWYCSELRPGCPRSVPLLPEPNRPSRFLETSQCPQPA